MSGVLLRLRGLVPWVAVVVAIAAAFAVGRWTKKEAPAAAGTAGGMPGMDQGPAPPAGAGSSAVYIAPARQQLSGGRTGVVERRDAAPTVRAVGTLAYDQTHVTQIHVKFPGWVDHLYVDYLGQPVRRGQALFTEYSPEVVSAQSDYLVALQATRDAPPQVRADSDALVSAARNRLEQRWDMSAGEISAIESRGRATRNLTVFSPFDGVVIERNTFAGQYVMPQMSTFKIADLSTIWAVGEAFEYEASQLAIDDPIEIEFPYNAASPPIAAHIDFVHPDLDPISRRVRFRATLPNPGARLKPDTYVTIVLHGKTTNELVVPREAVIDTGARKYALLALADGYFAPRDVTVGPPVGEFYTVVSGLSEGDRVVTSAQFLVDSETNLMAAMQTMSMTMPGMDQGGGKKPPPSPSSSTMPPMPDMKMPMPDAGAP
ncbi:efflux RND transporter periplasmic adaptor subunit [soil metagenome]